MTRLKIRKNTRQPGVDPSSFKLGYLSGFRESEQATIERLLKEFEPTTQERDELLLEVHALNETLERREAEIKYLHNIMDEMTRGKENRSSITSPNFKLSASETLPGFAKGGLVSPEFFKEVNDTIPAMLSSHSGFLAADFEGLQDRSAHLMQNILNDNSGFLNRVAEDMSDSIPRELIRSILNGSEEEQD